MARKPAVTPAPTDSIVLPRPDIRLLHLRLIGDAPLICHAWSEKAKKQMLDKQMKRAKSAREAKSPEADFVESLYWLTDMPKTPSALVPEDARFGFPAIGFKAAAVDACTSVDGLTKVSARQAFHVVGGDLVEINGRPTPREDMVRVGMGTADIRYRGEFKEWSADLAIRFNAGVLSAEQIMHLFDSAGFGVGVGEWRPQRNGQFGLFHVAREGEG